MGKRFIAFALQISDPASCSTARADGAAVSGQPADSGFLMNGGQV